MNISEGLKQLFIKTGVKQKELANDLGYKSPAVISNAIARENITLDVLVRMCNQLGYNVVLRPSVVKPAESEIIIDIPKKDCVSGKTGDSE